MKTISMSTTHLNDWKKAFSKEFPKDFEISSEKKMNIELDAKNTPLFEFLMDHNFPFNISQDKAIRSLLGLDYVPENLGELEIGSPNDFFNKSAFMNDFPDPVLEMKIVDKWYPIKSTVSKFRLLNGSTAVELNIFAKIGALNYTKTFFISDGDFRDAADKKVSLPFNKILEGRGLRTATKEAVEHAKKLNSEILSFANKSGQLYDAWGVGMTYSQWWGFDDINVGWADAPTKVIVEPLLENPQAHYEVNAHDIEWHLPFVRCFSLKHKSYIYVSIESVKKHEYVRDGKEKIVLPKNMMTALESIFNAKRENIFGDLFHGRHGGIVVLANGPSGVGKTLTAEVFAEYQERPLYPIEVSEIGTSVKEVEANLQRIFARAKKWNAVLLFDEADIFLAERVSSDLERSAIVGIFLRLLDYYEGTFFLTTNRGDGIDKAFKSRVTLYLNYPELSVETRTVIWKNMLKAANVEVTETTSWSRITEKKLNGRQIRNQVRLLKMMFPDGRVSTSDILESLEFAAN